MNFIENESEQKLRGGYYTPLDLAVYITRWVMEKQPKSILEPSCGDGVFVQALQETGNVSLPQFVGFEIVEKEAIKARIRCRKTPKIKAKIHAEDFLAWAIDQMELNNPQFDAVVGNPPFIRYQYLSEDAQRKAEAIFNLLQLPFTKHTNAWVPFILSSIALLNPGGRLGMIVPSEIIHVVHAQSLRTYLGKVCSRLLIIDPTEIWFDGTLQGAVILFAEKKKEPLDNSDGLGIVNVSGREFLSGDPSDLFDDTSRMNGKTIVGKWTRALLTTDERKLLDNLCEHQRVYRFESVAKVDVGIVTGANKFFLVNDDIVKRFRLEPYSHPMFGRSEHCPGVIYDKRQHEENARIGYPTNFLWFKDDAQSEGMAEYIRLGEEQKLHTRYKCRVRKPWYTVPSVYSTDIGMLKRAHDMPRLIHNRIAAYTTDTAYRIEATGCNAEKLIYCFMNALTALSAELEGRHYGGGVLELVPSEIERLLIPLPPLATPDLERLDSLVRKSSITKVLEQQNKRILGKLGLSKSSQEELLAAWVRLRNRRQRLASNEDVNQSR